MTFKEYDFCMRRKCKNCTLEGECKYINRLHETRLLWHPFENLDKIIKEKKKYDT